MFADLCHFSVRSVQVNENVILDYFMKSVVVVLIFYLLLPISVISIHFVCSLLMHFLYYLAFYWGTWAKLHTSWVTTPIPLMLSLLLLQVSFIISIFHPLGRSLCQPLFTCYLLIIGKLSNWVLIFCYIYSSVNRLGILACLAHCQHCCTDC